MMKKDGRRFGFSAWDFSPPETATRKRNGVYPHEYDTEGLKITRVFFK